MEGQHQPHFREGSPETILFKTAEKVRGVRQRSAAAESILTFALTVWFGSVSAKEERQLNKVVCTASKIIGCEVPSLTEIYKARLQKKGRKILKDPSHPANCLFNFLPAQRRLRCIKTRKTRFQNSTYPQAVRLLNTQELAGFNQGAEKQCFMCSIYLFIHSLFIYFYCALF